ncbi:MULTISPECIES: ABC transporter ATP-binding protein [unclassified Achromobacter]|uniref:ABC transporter ATP-binding protein n=1 Tax=unclassified Achromobacter TaxID=2626865 RepID=UPI000B51690F|nr:MULTISPECIES: ABC transporter ATP-binding protein [unclassified Achromobacter]OWT74534.1 ABC transporter ATP-binding protein [Achromobacter sp. HZ34]OWT79001.1 ABC transporter ATP-binding protein [Achromobacter sp. HZ28]
MLLEVQDINTYYGPSQAIHNVSFNVGDSEVVALLGRNGAGKSTTLRSIMGLNGAASGRIQYAGQDITRMSPQAIARLGVTLVPETRDPFVLLTVRENILLGYREGSPYTLDRLMDLFPLLRELLKKKGGELSGGQQQMMVMARGLAMGPRLLLLDEPSQGLAPIMVKAVANVLNQLKGDGLTILLVEQNLNMALELADRVVVLENGAVADTFDGATGRAEPARLEQYLAVH